MLYVMLLAHLLGDYVFQFTALVRWKTRSLAGVIAHGGIVTMTTLLCTMLVAPSWWLYALIIGLTHTVIDVVRARLLRITKSTWELAWYLLDQLVHIAVILLVVNSVDTPLRSELNGIARLLANRQILTFAIGYLLLTNPAWILLRFTVRGVWGIQAAPHLGQGEKYGPMIERLLIATCILIGQAYLVPLILLPRRLTPIHIDGLGAGVLVRPIHHWAETILSVLLAIGIGLVLRLIILGR